MSERVSESEPHINLLPIEWERRRSDTYWTFITVESYPEGYFPKKTAEDGSKTSFKGEDFPEEEIIGEVKYGKNLSIIKKAFPHCLHGVMLVNTKESDKVALQDFSKKGRLGFIKTALKFGEYSERSGLYPNVSWTYDPQTLDRSSGQSKKWFHMHLNAQTDKFKKEVEESRKPIRDLRSIEKRSIVDEFSISFSLALRDYFNNGRVKLKSGISFAPFDKGTGNLPNFGLVIDGSWDTINKKELDSDLKKIHEAQVAIYEDIQKLLFIGESGKWKRPRLIKENISKLNEIPYLSSETVLTLSTFFKGLKPELLGDSFFEENPSSKETSFLYPLAGPSYGVSITRNDENSLLVSIRPQMFSDSGTAGLYYMFGTVVRINRKGGNQYTEEQLSEKEEFERSLLEEINS